MRNNRNCYHTAILLISCFVAMGRLEAFVAPFSVRVVPSSPPSFPTTTMSRLTTATSRLQSMDDRAPPDEPAAAAADRELFQRALLQERLRLEGRRQRLLQKQQDLEPTADISSESDDGDDDDDDDATPSTTNTGGGDELYKALDDARLEREARARDAALLLQQDAPDEMEPTVEPPVEKVVDVNKYDDGGLYKALDDARLEREARARDAALLLEETLGLQPDLNESDEEAVPEVPDIPETITELTTLQSKVDNEPVQADLLVARLALESDGKEKSSSGDPSKDSSFEFQRSLLATRLALEAKARATAPIVTKEAELSAISQAAPPPMQESKAVVTGDDKQMVSVSVPEQEEEPPFWLTISAGDVSSALVKIFTPEKGFAELVEEEAEEVAGFAASRLFQGVVNGGKAAFLGVESIVAKTTPEPAVEAGIDSLQNLVSALVAVAALGWSQRDRVVEYGVMASEEAAKILEKVKELEEERSKREAILEAERKEQEAIRLAALKKQEEERLAAEKIAEEKRQLEEEEQARIAAELKAEEDLVMQVEEARRTASELLAAKIEAKKNMDPEATAATPTMMDTAPSGNDNERTGPSLFFLEEED